MNFRFNPKHFQKSPPKGGLFFCFFLIKLKGKKLEMWEIWKLFFFEADLLEIHVAFVDFSQGQFEKFLM